MFFSTKSSARLTTPNLSFSLLVSDPMSFWCPAAAAAATSRRRAGPARAASAAGRAARSKTKGNQSGQFRTEMLRRTEEAATGAYGGRGRRRRRVNASGARWAAGRRGSSRPRGTSREEPPSPSCGPQGSGQRAAATLLNYSGVRADASGVSLGL